MKFFQGVRDMLYILYDEGAKSQYPKLQTCCLHL